MATEVVRAMVAAFVAVMTKTLTTMAAAVAVVTTMAVVTLAAAVAIFTNPHMANFNNTGCTGEF